MTFFRQIIHEDLGCASYIFGDGNQAIVVDPRFDFDIYLEVAEAQGARITNVIDTHDHADHISGRELLAKATGAVARRPFRKQEPRDQDLRPGDEILVGNVVIRALKANGHRPEHLAFVAFDLGRTPEPWFVLTGDSLLVGDVARPDLAVEPEQGAEDLYDTIQGLISLGDRVEVWPGHVGGSLCGGAGLSNKTSSTIGYERIANPGLLRTPEQFVRELTSGIPARPPNVTHIVEQNRQTIPLAPGRPPLVSAEGLAPLVQQGVTILDCRAADEFDRAHIPGSLNLPATGTGLGTRAGWALDRDEPVAIVAPDQAAADRIVSALWSVGLWNLVGVTFDPGAAATDHVDSWSVAEVAEQLRSGKVTVVDIRESSEQVGGYLPDSLHLPLAVIGNGRSLPISEPNGAIAVACSAGRRSPIAASLLRRGGWGQVVRVDGGGIDALASQGFRLETAG